MFMLSLEQDLQGPAQSRLAPGPLGTGTPGPTCLGLGPVWAELGPWSGNLKICDLAIVGDRVRKSACKHNGEVILSPHDTLGHAGGATGIQHNEVVADSSQSRRESLGSFICTVLVFDCARSTRTVLTLSE